MQVMKRVLQVIGIIVLLLAVTFAVIHFVKTENDKHKAPVAAVSQIPQPPTAQELLDLTNAERAKVGVAPLKLDDRLNQSAQAKAQDMDTYKYLQHDNPITGKKGTDWVYGTGLACQLAGENLYMGTMSSTEAINGWMNSAPHKQALLRSAYDIVGFGIVPDEVGNSGGYIVVQHFCDLP